MKYKTIKQLKSEMKELEKQRGFGIFDSWKKLKAQLSTLQDILGLINEPIRTDRFFNKCKKCGEPYETTEAYRKGFAKLQRELKSQIEGK